MTFFQAFVIGIIQGLTEFIPVSSTAHIAVIPSLLGLEGSRRCFHGSYSVGHAGGGAIYFRAISCTLSALFLLGYDRVSHFGIMTPNWAG